VRRLLGLLALAAASASAQPFIRTVAAEGSSGTICVAWSNRTFVYHVDNAGSVKTPGDTEFTAIDSAFASWQAVSDGCSDFQFVRGPRVINPKVGLGTQDTNVLTFRDTSCGDIVAPNDPCLADGSCGNVHQCWDHSAGTIGLTTSTFSTKTGVIYDSDIEFNAADFLFTTVSSPPCQPGKEATTCVATDVQNTATHEIGHVVGLDHVPDPTSTMAASAPVGEISKRTIDQGTQQGFCQTYPAGQPPTPCDQLASLTRRINGRTVGAPGCTCADSTAAGPVALLAALWLSRRRR
jgi:uncharacterized protein (TIGR03382 family)